MASTTNVRSSEKKIVPAPPPSIAMTTLSLDVVADCCTMPCFIGGNEEGGTLLVRDLEDHGGKKEVPKRSHCTLESSVEHDFIRSVNIRPTSGFLNHR